VESGSGGLMLMSGPSTPPTVTVSALDASAREGSSDDAVLQFTRSGDTSMSLAVNYTLGGGTAGQNDYMALPVSPMSFLPGQATVNVTVDAMADNLVEGSETAVATLQPGMGYIVGGPSTAQVTIVDDPAVVSIAATDPLATEPMGNAAQFTVSRTGGNLQQSLTVPLSYSGTAQHLGDYNASTSVLLVGGQASATINVQPMQDAAVEGPETVIATLSTPAGNPPQYTLGTSVATATILDDDSTPSLSINDVSVVEGDAGTTQAVFTLQLSAATANTVTVQYATADGTATAGSDYQQTTGSHTFQPGETQKSISVPVIGDTVYEPNETFYVNPSNVAFATLQDAQGQGTIQNDDAAPQIDIDTDSNNDGQITGADDPAGSTFETQEPGNLLWYNWTDDNGNGQQDRLDGPGFQNPAGQPVADVELEPVQIALSPAGQDLTGYTVTLEAGNGLKIWRNQQKEAFPSLTFAAVDDPNNPNDNPLPSVVYVEGVGLGVWSLTATLQNSQGVAGQDAVTFTVVRFELSTDGDTSLNDAGDLTSRYTPGYLLNGETMIEQPMIAVGQGFNGTQFNSQEMKLVLEGLGESALQNVQSVTFELVDVSAIPGYAENKSHSNIEGQGKTADYSFDPIHDDASQPGDFGFDRVTVPVYAKDYGGRAEARVLIQMKETAGGATVTRSIHLPVDTDTDHLADVWEVEQYQGWIEQYDETFAGAGPLDLVGEDTPQNNNDVESEDPDGDGGMQSHEQEGDSLSAAQEYRGYVLDGGVGMTQPGHRRLDVFHKELLVEVDVMAFSNDIPTPPPLISQAEVATDMSDMAAGMSHPTNGAGIHAYWVLDQYGAGPYVGPEQGIEALDEWMADHRNAALPEFVHLGYADADPRRNTILGSTNGFGAVVYVNSMTNAAGGSV
jgi:hypothetical protein